MSYCHIPLLPSPTYQPYVFVNHAWPLKRSNPETLQHKVGHPTTSKTLAAIIAIAATIAITGKPFELKCPIIPTLIHLEVSCSLIKLRPGSYTCLSFYCVHRRFKQRPYEGLLLPALLFFSSASIHFDGFSYLFSGFMVWQRHCSMDVAIHDWWSCGFPKKKGNLKRATIAGSSSV